MSNTRKAESGKPFRQERYASSIEYDRGLMASLVARRCSVIERAEDRELVYFLQLRSHHEDGLRGVVAGLLAKFPHFIGTASMHEFGMKPGQVYSLAQCEAVRSELTGSEQDGFPLRNDEDFLDAISERPHRNQRAEHPANYPAKQFLKVCQNAAETEFESDLKKLCLDPAIGFNGKTTFAPWYFPNALEALRHYQTEWIADHQSGVVVTEIGQKVCETLDFTAQSQCMTVLDGLARIGKSFAARTWCEQHPGQARYVEVPTGNDDVGFFRAIARGIGLGNFQQYKAVEIRERVESVLLTGDLILCLDEAHRLWPEVNIRYGFPKRINWVMSMANQSVPICLVGTPQFIERQKATELSGWNSAQFIGRIGHYEKLPDSLAEGDLMKVAESLLPEGDARAIEILVRYAQGSAKYLAGIECAVRRARYLAGRAGRKEVINADIKIAIQGSVIPSDSALAAALTQPAKGGRKRHLSPVEMPVEAAPIPQASHRRGGLDQTKDFTSRRQTAGELVPVPA
jgi:hypothetical protein